MDKPTISLIRSQCYVDGQWIGEPKLPVTNKATGDVIAKVPSLGEAETRAAIEAANRALPAWAKLLAKERSRILRRWFDLIIEHADELALLLTTEQGKPLAEAKGEIVYAAGFVEFFAEEAKRIYGETIPTIQGGRAHRRHQAAGRRRRRHHAVEFPRRHDHAQGGPGARRRLHRGVQAGRRDAADGAGPGRARRARRGPQGRVQRHHRQGQRDRQGADRRARWCACSPSPARPRSAAC